MPRPYLVLFALLLPLASQAENLEIPIGEQGVQTLDLPARGTLRGAVLGQFGLPDEEHPAVGQPPITRWDYREFSVYFEYDHVVDAVRHHQRRTSQPAQEAQP